MVASVPEFANRTWSRPKRREISSAMRMVLRVVTAKWVPVCAAFSMASMILGWAWPTMFTPKPPWPSTYSLPSTSHTWLPSPRSR